MAEYIERDMLCRILECYQKAPKNRYQRGVEDGMELALNAVKAIHTADVAPVVHARWVDDKCSNCGVDIPTDDARDAIFGSECHFCYYCGAKMDGGRRQ